MKTNHTNSESKKTSTGAMSQCPDKRNRFLPPLPITFHLLPLKQFVLFVLIRAIRVLLIHTTSKHGKFRHGLAELGRIWQNMAERYSLGQVQILQYLAGKGVTKNEGEN